MSVVWSFLGLEQRTAAMPANNAQFHTNSSYFGPMSRNMTEFVQKVCKWDELCKKTGQMKYYIAKVQQLKTNIDYQTW